LLDISALHPDLRAGAGSSYFKECRKLRTATKDELAEALDISEHDLFLLPSTSSALATLLFAACQANMGCELSGPPNQHYPPFLSFFTKPVSADHASLVFRTHVSPLTGRVDPLSGPEPNIVDGAQSLGTCLTGALLLGSEIAVAPLHKHLGLAVGLAAVLVRKSSSLSDAFCPALRVVEAGAQSISGLRDARRRLLASQGAIFNKATLSIDASVRTSCTSLGLSLLGSSGPPFACVTTLDGSDIAERLRPGSWRHLKEANAARFSFDHRDRAQASPIDRTDALMDALHTLAR
jgi:hypothetical protein